MMDQRSKCKQYNDAEDNDEEDNKGKDILKYRSHGNVST